MKCRSAFQIFLYQTGLILVHSRYCQHSYMAINTHQADQNARGHILRCPCFTISLYQGPRSTKGIHLYNHLEEERALCLPRTICGAKSNQGYFMIGYSAGAQGGNKTLDKGKARHMQGRGVFGSSAAYTDHNDNLRTTHCFAQPSYVLGNDTSFF